MLMQWVKRGALLCTVAGLSSGCMMYRLEELRNTTPQGSPFQTALSRMYMDFAAKKEKSYDWPNSWYFADKGLRLAYGKDAEPEELDGWNLDDASKMELEKARIRVMDTLTPALKAGAPNRAAMIEFNFDCWVEYAEAGWQTEEIANCRDNLMHSLNGSNSDAVESRPLPAEPMEHGSKKNKVTKWAKPTVFKAPEGETEKAPKSVMPEKPAGKAAKGDAKKEVMAETASYAVFFEAGKPDVSGPGKNVLNEVVNSLKGKSDYVVILHVAPLTGSAAQEKDLPGKRITVVKKVLTDGGVSSSAIVNADGPEAAKPVARRIELFLNE